MLDKRMRRYYRQIMFGNRSALARTLDFAALRAIMFIAFLLWFSLQTSNIMLSCILSGCATGMVSVALGLYKNIRLDKFVAQKRRELTRIYMLEQFVLMPRRDFVRRMAAMARQSGYEVEQLSQRGVLCRDKAQNPLMLFALQNHPEDEIGPHQVVDSYRYLMQQNIAEGILVCTAALNERASSLLTKLKAPAFTVWDQDKLLALARALDMLPDADEVEQGLLVEIEQRRLRLRQFKKQAFATTRVRSYLICGFVLFFAAIITGQHLYYPIMGAVCFFMAFLSYFLDQGRQRTEQP